MKFYFETKEEMREFAKMMINLGKKVVDYGINTDRLVDKYFIDVQYES